MKETAITVCTFDGITICAKSSESRLMDEKSMIVLKRGDHGLGEAEQDQDQRIERISAQVVDDLSF